MAITTLVFDIGGVILTNDAPYESWWTYGSFMRYFDIGTTDMDTAWGRLRPDFRTGKMTEDQFWADFLKLAGVGDVTENDLKAAKSMWRQYQDSIERMPELVKRLKEQYRIGALTNTSREWLAFKRKQFGLDDLFEVIVSSAECGVQKPDAEIYQLFLERARVRGDQCVYVDNTGRNLPPAKSVGMETIEFEGQQKLEHRLHELGIRF